MVRWKVGLLSLLLLLALSACLNEHFEDLSTDADDNGAHSLSQYHRKLLGAPEIAEMPEFLAAWNQTTLAQRRMWPTWWNEEKEEALKRDILIGIVTSKSIHSRLQYQRASWWTDERKDMVEVYTDVEFDANVTNLVFSHCDSSYHYGLWCKNKHMLRMWQSPRYRSVKWFVRANDDSYYHLENMHDYLSKLDHTQSIVIGEQFCADAPWHCIYPSGGPGIIVSRGFVDTMNWDAWDSPLKKKLKIGRFFEDVLWGRYMNDTGDVTFIQHNGVSQDALTPNSFLMNIFLQYRDKPWPFPFRPMAYHQTGKFTTMVALHRKLHSIDYYPPGEVMFDLPKCGCRYNFHSRCMWDLTKKGNRMPCRWTSLGKDCLGPGDYSYNGYLRLVEQNKTATLEQAKRANAQHVESAPAHKTKANGIHKEKDQKH